MASQGTVAKPRHVSGMETYGEKATRKFKENPWVPLGSLVTVGALVVAMVKMRRGQSQSFNHWLRVRVAAQGITILALVAGTYSLRPKDTEISSADPTLTRNDVDVERRRLEKVAKEKDEFEERLRGAEEAHVLETELRAGRSGREPANPASASVPKDSTTVPMQTGGSWLGWLGWGRTSGSSPSIPTNPSNQTPSTSRPGIDSTTKS